MLFDHVWHWKTHLPERFGHACRVSDSGIPHHVLIDFEDGYRVVANGYAVRKREDCATETLHSASKTARPAGLFDSADRRAPEHAAGSALQHSASNEIPGVVAVELGV